MIDQDELKRQLYYDPETGIFTQAALGRRNNRSYIGKEIGSLNNSGYLAVRINYKSYLLHRLAWLYMYGEWPEYQIDHINLNRTDNRFANLRKASNAENNRNTNLRSTNKSGVKGVYWNKSNSKWRARVQFNGKFTHLGYHSTIESASAAYNAFAQKHYGEFYRMATA